jgi:hypothetical protein
MSGPRALRGFGPASRIAISAVVAVAVSAGAAQARPNYFEVFTGLYGLTPGEDLYACGVCHRRWEGTGARNPYGNALEQQLYIGKTITNAILDVEDDDTDLDGFTNGDEIANWITLPGYSCADYDLVINPPSNFQMLITPGVPSCLEPKDVEVTPTVFAFLTEVGKVGTVAVEVRNNGTDEDITVSGFELLAGSSPRLMVSGAPAPIVVAVGETATLEVSFTPVITEFVSGTLRIATDDPDEPTIDVGLTGIAFVKNLAPVAARAACFAEAEKRLAKLGRTSLKEWGRCYLDELAGVACDAGHRNLKLAQAEARLRNALGGSRDRRCAGAGLTPSRLDLPDFCAAPCGSIELNTIADWADCLVCRQEAATDAMLEAAIGTSPPDLPANLLGKEALRCNAKVVKGMQRGIAAIQDLLGDCALENVTAASPSDCPVVLASEIAAAGADVDADLASCRSTSDMEGCRFEPGADPTCLGDAATAIGAGLVDAVFGTAP